MRSLLTYGLPLALACALFACGNSSSGTGSGKDAGKDGTEPSMDAEMDTTPVMMGDGAPDGPPLCRNMCPKTAAQCCENADSPNFGLCYDPSNTTFCANEGGAP